MRIGVDEATVFNWEAGTASPSLRALPEVIRFLGHDPRQEAEAFPERIRQLRQGLGLSIKELAERIGVDPTTVQKWEQLGYRPRPRLYARLTKVLEIPEPSVDTPLRERLRTWRLTLGLTQSELAARIDVSQDTISRWELCRTRPTREELGRVCRIMGIDQRKNLKALVADPWP